MKKVEKELKETKENGTIDAAIEKAKETMKPIEVVLTIKQKAMLNQVLNEKADLQRQIEAASKKEMMLSTLILDAHGIDSDETVSVELNQEGTIFRVVKKE